jgi:hypothetical protein
VVRPTVVHRERGPEDLGAFGYDDILGALRRELTRCAHRRAPRKSDLGLEGVGWKLLSATPWRETAGRSVTIRIPTGSWRAGVAHRVPVTDELVSSLPGLA